MINHFLKIQIYFIYDTVFYFISFSLWYYITYTYYISNNIIIRNIMLNIVYLVNVKHGHDFLGTRMQERLY
jgi:hypothetical protein